MANVSTHDNIYFDEKNKMVVDPFSKHKDETMPDFTDRAISTRNIIPVDKDINKENIDKQIKKHISKQKKKDIEEKDNK